MKMNYYLTVMVTVLVVTQVIRILQNAIQLHRHSKMLSKDLAWIRDNEVTERDFDVQRDCFYLLRDWLEREMGVDYGRELGDSDESSGDLYAYTPEFCSSENCCEDCDNCHMRHSDWSDGDIESGYDPFTGRYSDDC